MSDEILPPVHRPPPTLRDCFISFSVRERRRRADRDNKLCLDAFGIALNQACDGGGQWYASTTALQLVCFDMCRACRALAGFAVVVRVGTPVHVWLRHSLQSGRNKRPSSRVPSLKACSVTWELSVARISEGGKFVHEKRGFVASGLWRLFGVRGCSKGVIRAWWSDTLRKMTLGPLFNYPVMNVVWPTCLEQLVFGRAFDQPIGEVVWPVSLQRLTVG